MDARSLGPDAPAVPMLGYGAMPLSLIGRPDEADSIAVLHRVFDAGVRLIDTADSYCIEPDEVGHNERLVAKALASWSGERGTVLVATKGGSVKADAKTWRVNGRPEHLRAACDQSLRSLGVERIELYQLHGPDPSVPFEESIGTFAELRGAGKIRHVGLSNVNVKQIEAARRIVPIQSVQNLLNPFFRGSIRGGRWFRRSVLAHCQRRGLGFLAFSPVGGLLQHKVPEHPVVREIAARHGASPHCVVLAWVLAQGPNVIPIPASRSVDHALDSLAAAELRLGATDLAAIDAAEFPCQP